MTILVLLALLALTLLVFVGAFTLSPLLGVVLAATMTLFLSPMLLVVLPGVFYPLRTAEQKESFAFLSSLAAGVQDALVNGSMVTAKERMALLRESAEQRCLAHKADVLTLLGMLEKQAQSVRAHPPVSGSLGLTLWTLRVAVLSMRKSIANVKGAA